MFLQQFRIFTDKAFENFYDEQVLNEPYKDNVL